MLVAWNSRTGNVERFVKKINIKNVKIHSDIIIDEPFVLVTYTTGFGQCPQATIDFMNNNREFCYGVSSSGNMNWGNNYAMAADFIAEQYNVPIINKFELSGTKKDVEIFIEGLRKLNDC